MNKRIIIIFSGMMFLFCISMILLNDISTKDILYDAAAGQRSYKLKITDVRGTIYDCNKVPLVNRLRKRIAAVTPGTRISNELSDAISNLRVSELWEKLSLSEPFTIEVNRDVNCSGIKTFEVPIRYAGVVPAAHIVGYLSGDGRGVSGIEMAYDGYLRNEDSDVCVRYNVDATNRLLLGGQGVVDDKSYLITKGVVLNLDYRIQVLAEQIANKYISKGAVIITEVPNCEIRALVSLPSFMPQDVSKYLKDQNSPLINRAFSQYNFGSIFKLVTAAAALECGIDESFQYDCNGWNEVDGNKFKCFDGKAHGLENMSKATAYSCNGYFIQLAKKMGADVLLSMSEKFHFGRSIEFAPGMFSSKGILPSRESLDKFGALANFSFGQGKLMAVPVQVSGLINAIASNGVYSVPKLVCGLVNEDMKIKEHTFFEKSERVISVNTSEKIKSYMVESIEYGTSNRGKPKKVSAAAKTSTAQTGIISSNGNEVIQSWYAGFFPLDKPKYSIVILSEGETSGGGLSCGPVFSEIADTLYSEFEEKLIE